MRLASTLRFLGAPGLCVVLVLSNCSPPPPPAPAPAPVVVVQPPPPPPTPVVEVKRQPSRAETEIFLKGMLYEHFRGIEHGRKTENQATSDISDCNARFQTSNDDDVKESARTDTKAQSNLKDVVDVRPTKADRIRITGSASSTKVTFASSTAPPQEEAGGFTIVLNNADSTTEIVEALKNLVTLCGGVRQGMFR